MNFELKPTRNPEDAAAGVGDPGYNGASRRRGFSLGWRAAVGAAILVGLLAVQRVDGGALWGTLRRVDGPLLVAACASFLLLMAVKSWRWNFLVDCAGLRYGFWPSFRSYLGAFVLGIVTPGRLGELARAAQLRSETGAEWEPCLRTVVADRLFDLVFLASFGPFALCAVWVDGVGDGILLTGFISLYVAVALTLGMSGKLLSRWRPKWRPLQFVLGCLESASRDLTGRTGLIGSAITFLSYAVYFGGSLVLLRALGMGLSFRDVACVTGCLSLILLLPISIAGVGTREATLLVLLGRYGVAREEALAYSILQFAVFTLFGGIVGAIALAASPRAERPANLAAGFAATSPHTEFKPRSR